MLTGDTPYVGVKGRGGGPPITDEQYLANLIDHLPASVDASVATTQDASIELDPVRWLTGLSGLPVIVKGVLRGDDARACLDAGAAGVIVSNHGGRQLERSVPAATALREVVDAVAGRGHVLVDGGVRTGEDVLAALAYQEHLAHVMALAGAARVGQVDRDLIA